MVLGRLPALFFLKWLLSGGHVSFQWFSPTSQSSLHPTGDQPSHPWPRHQNLVRLGIPQSWSAVYRQGAVQVVFSMHGRQNVVWHSEKIVYQIRWLEILVHCVVTVSSKMSTSRLKNCEVKHVKQKYPLSLSIYILLYTRNLSNRRKKVKTVNTSDRPLGKCSQIPWHPWLGRRTRKTTC